MLQITSSWTSGLIDKKSSICDSFAHMPHMGQSTLIVWLPSPLYSTETNKRYQCVVLHHLVVKRAPHALAHTGRI